MSFQGFRDRPAVAAAEIHVEQGDVELLPADKSQSLLNKAHPDRDTPARTDEEKKNEKK